jgi:hypothetical protein
VSSISRGEAENSRIYQYLNNIYTDRSWWRKSAKAFGKAEHYFQISRGMQAGKAKAQNSPRFFAQPPLNLARVKGTGHYSYDLVEMLI